MLKGTVYLPGSVVDITDIGKQNGTDPEDYGGALVCVTTNVTMNCCRTGDGGNVGEWYFPNGTIVPRQSNPGGSAFTRSGSTQQVRLNRIDSDATSPTGEFECRVPDSSRVMQNATIIIGESVVI